MTQELAWYAKETNGELMKKWYFEFIINVCKKKKKSHEEWMLQNKVLGFKNVFF